MTPNLELHNLNLIVFRRAKMGAGALLLVALTLLFNTSWAVAQPPLPTSPPGTISGSDNNLRNDRLGVAHISSAEGGTPEERYRQALHLGAGWNRWPLYWDRVETEPGVFNWERYDRQVVDDLRHGLHINAILLGRPAFHDGDFVIAGINEPVFSDGSDTPGPDKTLNPDNPWVNFVYAAVQRYKPGGVLAQNGTLSAGSGITVWEVWNEPDHPSFWNGGIRTYARLLKTAYLAIKHADPFGQVMVGGLTFQTEDNWLARVLAIYSNDPQRSANNWYMDIVAVHNYANPWRTGWLVLFARQTLISYDLSRPIWVNETGVPVWDDYPGPTWAETLEERQLRATSEQQAWFYIQSAIYGWVEGADVIIYHQLYDDCGDQPAGSNFPPHRGELCSGDAICAGDAHGMFRNLPDSVCFSQHPQAGSARPAAEAFRLMAQIFHAPFGNGNQLSIDENALVMRFDRTRSDERILVMWNQSFETVTLEIPAEGRNAQLLSLEEKTLIRPRNETYTIELPPAQADFHPEPPVGAESAIGGPPYFLIERIGGSIDPFVVRLDSAVEEPSNTGTAGDSGPRPNRTLAPPVTEIAVGPTVNPAEDITPPTATLSGLPVISGTTFTLRWSGEDDSGIKNYLVWVRVDNGEWQSWIETPDTQANYTGTPGSLIEFDIWAEDLAGNWSTDIDLTPKVSTRIGD